MGSEAAGTALVFPGPVLGRIIQLVGAAGRRTAVEKRAAVSLAVAAARPAAGPSPPSWSRAGLTKILLICV